MSSNELPLNFAGPDVSDVHVPSPSKKISQKIKQKTSFTIEGVPIFKAGTWKDKQYTITDLDEIVQNTNALIKSRIHEPPAKLGHSEDQQILAQQGLPSAGYVSKIYRLGDEIFADFVNVPKEIMELLNERRYDKISSEIYLEFNHPTTHDNIGKVLRAVAFLGADVPEVKGLGSILYHTENKSKYESISFDDKNLQEVNSMSRKWELKEIKNLIPCCYDVIAQYMETNKTEFIEADKLAEILATMKVDKIKNGESPDVEILETGLLKMRGEGSIECPDGYSWDERTESCVPKETMKKEQDTTDRKVCPKGYQWDDKQNKCVQVMETIDPTKKKPIEENPINEPAVVEEKDKKSKEVVETPIGEAKPIDETNPEETPEEKKKKLEGEVKPEDKPMGGIDEAGFGRSLIGAVLSAYGKEFDPAKPLHTQISEDELKQLIADITEMKEMKVKKPISEPIKETENIEVTELKAKIKQFEEQKLSEHLENLKKDNRGIFLPKFDNYITNIYQTLSENDKLVKFGDTEKNVRNIFIEFLQEIQKSKTVIFAELSKDRNKLEVTEESMNAQVEKYNEIAPNRKLVNEKLAILADQISLQENIPYKSALIKANKILIREDK